MMCDFSFRFVNVQSNVLKKYWGKTVDHTGLWEVASTNMFFFG